jgi:secreted PhoX family phosphatase
MNSVNETGRHAGRYLYRTHEVDNGGAVTVVDLVTGDVKVIAQATDGDPGDLIGPTFPEFTTGKDLDGIRWTPWGTLLFAEEDPLGKLYEMYFDENDPSEAIDVKLRDKVGLTCHEGIETGTDGSVYVINEFNGGSIFKFVPDRYGDLSSGQLYALQIQGIDAADQLYDDGSNDDKHVGPFEWVALDENDISLPEDDASCADGVQAAADVADATQYGRPEDLERIGPVLYVANTSEDRVLAIDLNHQVVSAFVTKGDNAPGGNGNPNFNNPDNLAQGPDGRLWIVEDTTGSDIWVADRDRDGDGKADGVYQFAAILDSGAEGTGIYFGKDPQTLFVNIQHAAKPLADGTWAVTKRNTPSRKIVE